MSKTYSFSSTKNKKHPKVQHSDYQYFANEPRETNHSQFSTELLAELLESSTLSRQDIRRRAQKMRSYM